MGIVVLGHPRSGTTLLRRLINAHSRIACPPETHLLSACARFLDAEQNAHGVDIGVLAGLSFAGIEDEIVLEKLRAFAFSFLSEYAGNQGKPRWAEKTAFDSFHIDNIERLCGDHVYYLGIVRHGLDVAISSKDFCDAAGMYPRVMQEYIRRYSQPIEAFAHSWLDVNQKLLEFAERHQDNCLIYRYEDIVRDPESSLTRILRFVGEDFEPEMLRRGLDGKDQLGFSDHKSYQTQKVHDASVERWHSLPQQQINNLAPLVNPLLAEFGYDTIKTGKNLTTNEARRLYTSGLKLVTGRKTDNETLPQQDTPPLPLLKYYGRDEVTLSDSGWRVTSNLDEETSRKIMKVTEGASPALVFSASLLSLLRRITGAEDLGIGISIPVVSDTEASSCEPILKTIPVRLGMNSGQSFSDVLHEVDRILQDSQHEQRDIASFDVQLKDYSTFPESAIGNSDTRSGDGCRIDSQNSLTISIESSPSNGSFDISFDFNEGVWPDPGDRNRALTHFQMLIDSLVKNTDQIIDRVFLLTPEEQELLFPTDVHENAFPSRLPTVIDRFNEQVERRPDHPAVVFQDQKLSYGELGERVWMMSAFLRSKGVGPDSLVAICINRSLDMVTALLAVMHAGGTYIPIDPGQPESRISRIMEDVDPVVVLCERSNQIKVAGARSSTILFIEDDNWKEDKSKISSRCGDHGELAYIIFTSGSTGRPKGVEVFHHGLSAFLEAMGEQPGLNENDRLLAVTTISFDIAALEIFLPLVTGATVHIATNRDAMDGSALQGLLTKNEISVFQATPATYHILLASGWHGSPRLKLLCGGEAFPSDLAARLLDCCGELWNMYGPTETTIWSTIKKIENANAPISIGGPIPGTQIYVLNSSMSPVPPGVPGELFIAGEGVARGYHGRSELTAERFLDNAFSNTPGARMYRTGDLVRSPDGSNTEYIGRQDNQVKIRGFRVELGEIETAISSHDSVLQNVVSTYESHAGTNSLVAYIVLEPGAEILGTDEIREHLKARLPAYMIPSKLIVMDSLPLTPNNKVDRKALPKPSDDDLKTDRNDPLPTSPTAQKIINSWKRLLGTSSIGIDDSFMALGGDSLTFVEASLVLEGILGHIPDEWETMPIRELSTIKRKDSLVKNLDSVVIVRALGIAGVVLAHLEFGIGQGATSALFIAAGYLFANFQLRGVYDNDSSRSILSSIFRICLPTILYVALLQLWIQDFDLANLLFVGNFRPPGYVNGVGEYWFVFVLVQLLLILAALLSFKKMRHLANARPFQFSVAVLAVAAALRYIGPYIWDTEYLFNRVPHMWLWMFAIGWCIYYCDTNVKKIFIACALIILTFIPLPREEFLAEYFLTTTLPGLILLSFPAVILVFPLNRIFQYLAGASLFIYLTHFQFANLLSRLGIEAPMTINLLVVFAGGIAVWLLWDIFLSRSDLLGWAKRSILHR